MEQWATSLIENMSYWGIALLMFIENAFPPIPSEVVMPSAGFSAQKGNLNIWLVIVAGSIGSVAGAVAWYGVAYWVGEERFKRWVDKHGKWLAIFPSDIEKADKWFEKRGHWAVFLCRMIPGLRTLISIPAGLVEMPFWRFLAWSTLGTVGWTALLAGAGYLMGRNHDSVATFASYTSYVVVALLVMSVASWIYKRRKLHKRHKAQRAEDPAAYSQAEHVT